MNLSISIPIQGNRLSVRGLHSGQGRPSVRSPLAGSALGRPHPVLKGDSRPESPLEGSGLSGEVPNGAALGGNGKGLPSKGVLGHPRNGPLVSL